MYAQIALPVPLDDFYDYLIPPELESQVQAGIKVKVPFGRRTMSGFCVGTSKKTDVEPSKIKKIVEVFGKGILFDSTMLEFTKWWAQYYHCSLGEALEASIPSEAGNTHAHSTVVVQLAEMENLDREIQALSEKYPLQAKVLRFLKDSGEPVAKDQIRKKLEISVSPLESLQKKGLIRYLFREDEKDPFESLEISKSQSRFALTDSQKSTLDGIIRAIDQGKFQPFLLFGITGSGKTEVYLRSIERIVEKGKEAIVLVPEIALTPQTVIRFKQRFDHVAVLHSELTPSQRARQWEQIHAGKIQVVIGPRSAIFAPTHNLGLIVVDEEHEPSFKQQNTPRYNARDLAVKRAQMNDAIVILGSATPSLESYYNCEKKKYHFYHLPERIGKARLPHFIIIDMKEEYSEQKKFVYLSRALVQSITKTIEAQEQAILFLNRRGFATTVTCPVCGYEMKCEHCAVAMTYHKKNDRVLCHYCGYESSVPSECPICKFQGIRFHGAGTERIEAVLQKNFPNARIARMDSDTMTTREMYEKTFMAFSHGKIDILLGTQMIAKGLDFPKVTLVGIISADLNLQLPDFRASERTFQLMVQVAGRAGRGERPGQVILQTLHPDHYAIQSALAQNYEHFVAQELPIRKSLGYPPFSKLVRIIVEGQDEEQVKEKATEVTDVLRGLDMNVLGPAPAPISKIKDRFRWHSIIKCPDMASTTKCACQIRPFITGTASVRVQMDIDPISLL